MLMMLLNYCRSTEHSIEFYIFILKDKPAPIPEKPKEWNPRAPPEFVRDVMGLCRLFLDLGMKII